MVELKSKMTESGVFYVPKNIRAVFGREMKLIPNASAVVMFPAGTDYEDVLESMKIIAMDIKHRLNMQQKQEKISSVEE